MRIYLCHEPGSPFFVSQLKSKLAGSLFILPDNTTPTGIHATKPKKIEDYHTKVRLSGKPENQVLIESIESIRPAFLQSLWTDDISLLPDETAAWCELWIRVELDEYSENIDSTFKVLNDLEIEKQSDFLQFPQRLVCLIKANRSQLLNLFKSLGVIAELRLAKETARFWSQLEPVEQAEWVSDLSKRTIFSRLCCMNPRRSRLTPFPIKSQATFTAFGAAI